MTLRLSALHVGNFKAFADSQRIPLKPITLIFGPNSAGKSSFIHSLALAHEAQFGRDKRGFARLDVHHTDVGGSSIDLGGFRQFVYRGQAKRRVEWGAELQVAALNARMRELLKDVHAISVNLTIGIELDDQDRPKAGAEPRVEAVDITADGTELMYMSRRRADASGQRLRLDRLAVRHAVFRQIVDAIIESTTTTQVVHDEDLPSIDEAVATLLPELLVQTSRFLPETVELPTQDGANFAGANLLMPISKGNRGENIAQALRLYLPGVLCDLVGGLSRAVSGELERFRYLGPVRERPVRHPSFSAQRDANWQAGGGFAWDMLARDKSVRDQVNEWLRGKPDQEERRAELEAAPSRPTTYETSWMKTPYRLFVDRFTANGDLESALIAAFYERPLTLLERRQFLTKELAQVQEALREQYETDQSRADKYQHELEPWIERIQAAQSSAERERLTAEAMAQFEADEARRLDSPEGESEIFQDLQAEDAPLDAAVTRTAEFMAALEKRDVATIKELRLLDIKKGTAVSLCDVGFGISQVLPVLVHAYGSTDKLIAIEQPEIHLHPSLQAELADVFIESALGDRQNTFVLETHSEHMILRLLRRIRETASGELPSDLMPLTPDDVQILYVKPEATGSRFVELAISSEGDFVEPWPGGFFPERARELF